jgi:hypothetical protein
MDPYHVAYGMPPPYGYYYLVEAVAVPTKKKSRDLGDLLIGCFRGPPPVDPYDFACEFPSWANHSYIFIFPFLVYLFIYFYSSRSLVVHHN